ncbi:MAG TPA: fibronectin type III domain-containing protein, partial [Solirubrobacteraceae bacterium]|nr:fibronectin type III domain-containing protein [Solirubrobacteraceae bacterium]
MRSFRWTVGPRCAAALRCAAVLAAGAAVLPATALAASAPTVSTGAAREIGYGSAVLTGSVDPNGSDASYYFQYGVTKAYGGQTVIADAGAGVHTVSVRLPVTGLQPLTVYHYRLVAVNAAGPSIGADARLLTTKVPLSLQILASPNPVLFGGPITVQGTLSGTGNGNRVVVLQASSFPFTAGFQNVGNPLVTNAGGGFSFPLLGMT